MFKDVRCQAIFIIHHKPLFICRLLYEVYYTIFSEIILIIYDFISAPGACLTPLKISETISAQHRKKAHVTKIDANRKDRVLWDSEETKGFRNIPPMFQNKARINGVKNPSLFILNIFSSFKSSFHALGLIQRLYKITWISNVMLSILLF